MFSKQTISYLYNFMPQTHADMKMYMIRHDLDNREILKSTDNTLPKMSAAIVEYLVNEPDACDNFGNSIAMSLISELVSRLCQRYDFDEDAQDFPSAPGFYHFLRLDGYDIDFEVGKLKAVLPVDIKCQEKEDSLITFLDRYRFLTTKGHYQQAKANYLSNNAALTGQLRTFTESLLMDMAKHIKLAEPGNLEIANTSVTNATTAMQVLVKCYHPILDTNLNEWDGQGKGYFQSFWKRLHPQGSHPGLPVLDEAIYRYQLVLLNTTLIVKRFQTNY